MNPFASHRVLVTVVFALVTAVTAVGQAITPWSPMFENRFRSSITEATVDMLLSELRLSEAQENAVRHAFDEHRAAFEAFVAEHRPVKEEFERAVQRTRPRTLERVEREVEREERLAEIADEQAALDQQFFAEVKAMLTDEQLEYWDSFQRRFERAKYLKFCLSFPEQGIDQVELLEELLEEDSLDRDEWLTDHPEVAEVLLAYEMAIARPLQEWVRMKIESARHWYRRLADRIHVNASGRTFVGDYPSHQAKVQDQREKRRIYQLHRELVRVNRDYHRILTAALPEDMADRFNQAYVTAALCSAGIEGELPARGFVEAILERDDLTPEQRNAIEAHLLSYEYAVPELNRRAIRAQDAYTAVTTPGGPDGDRKDARQAWEEAVNRRLEREQMLIDNVYRLLTPEQQADVAVPQVPAPRD